MTGLKAPTQGDEMTLEQRLQQIESVVSKIGRAVVPVLEVVTGFLPGGASAVILTASGLTLDRS